ncbi:hypothetical protein KP509_03G078200 [Ceratopteris richardii]|nr:hypothetical protein KP509_03G078200 [Ceratopteris richardii]
MSGPLQSPQQSSDESMHHSTATALATPHHLRSVYLNNFKARPATTAVAFKSHRKPYRRSRTKSDDFCLRNRSSEQNNFRGDHLPLEKKSLGEFLNEIKADDNSDTSTQVGEDNESFIHEGTINKQASKIRAVNTSCDNSNVDDASRRGKSEQNSAHASINTDEEDCLACDKCFPSGKLIVVPLTDSRDYTEIPPKERDYRGTISSKGSTPVYHHSIFSWFRSKRRPNRSKHKVRAADCTSEVTGTSAQPGLSTVLANVKVGEANSPGESNKDMQIAMESMKQEVSQANKSRDDALTEVSELKRAIQEMGKKLGRLEDQYKCFDFPSRRVGSLMNMKRQLLNHDSIQKDNEDVYEHPRVSSSRAQTISMAPGPTKGEFCHAVVEARVGIKQFCRTLLQQLREKSDLDKIEMMLKAQNFKVNVSVKGGTVSKRVKYLMESLVNQVFYEDFENIKFTKSGSYCVLDPRQRPLAFFKTYMGILQVGWNELVSTDSSAYSASFDGFCDQKMSKIAEELLFFWDPEEGWPDELVEAFFIAAKWVWLLHLLAFSFELPATIFRVSNKDYFDSLYMEELSMKDNIDKQSGSRRALDERGTPQVLVMVMPGFFFNSYEVIRCKVLLSNRMR